MTESPVWISLLGWRTKCLRRDGLGRIAQESVYEDQHIAIMSSAATVIDQGTTESPRTSGRNSVLLLAGRCVSLVLNLAVQVLTVRFFSKLDYGAFAFVLSVVSVSSTALALGMDKTLSRYAAIYHEKRDLPKLFGSMCFALVLISLLGFVGVGVVGVASLAFGVSLLGEGLPTGLLLVLIVLAPVNALDSVVVALFGVFASPRSIVVRRYIVGPVLKLAGVSIVIMLAGNIYWLAIGHAVAIGLGAGIGALLLARLFHRDESLRGATELRWEYPAKELLGHSLPLMSTDVVMLLRTSLVIIVLEILRGSTAVAEYRAVSPLARLNEVTVTTLSVLFIPAVSRIFAQQNAGRVNEFYWQTASSLAVLSFPIFAATFVLAEPLTVLLLGETYRSSALVLSILALACYIHTSLGFNSQTLRVYGRVRAVVVTDLIASAVAIGGYCFLIPAYGPLGAAIATACGLLLHNLLNQLWLVQTTDVKLFNARYVATVTTIVGATVLLVAAQRTFNPHVAVSISLTALLSLAVAYLNRHALDLGDTFPSLARLPLFRQLRRSAAARN